MSVAADPFAPLRARADALAAKLEGFLGVPRKAIDAFVWATHRGRDPGPAMRKAWFGEAGTGPGADEAVRRWGDMLNQAEAGR